MTDPAVVRSLPPLRSILSPSRSGAYTALDIGPDGIVAVACATDGRSIAPACQRSLPAGVVTDGEVTSAEALATELRALVSEHGLPRDVRVGLAHSRLVLRTIEVHSSLEGDSLDAAVRHFAEGLLPMALDEVALDYRRTGLVPGDADQQRILIAAARLDGVERLMRALDLAGLRARQVSLCGLALLRALDAPPLHEEAILYVQASGLTNVVVAEDGEPVLARVASAGSEAITTSLAERASIPHADARRRVAACGVAGAAQRAEIDEQARQAVRDGLHRIVAEIHSSLEFYASREGARPVGAAVITGAMTTWPGVAEALSQELGLTVLPAGRDGWTNIDCDGVSPEVLDVAVGLALAPEDEHPDLRPAASRHAVAAASAPRTAQALCGVAAMAAAAIVYFVVVSNQLTSAEQRVDRLAGDTAKVQRQAAALEPYHTLEVATKARRETVAGVASSRFDWARVLRQLAEVTPDSVWLTSVTGTLAPGTQLEGGASGGSNALRGARLNPALELVGCSRREGGVPAYMDRLRGIGRATEVGFSRSERLEKSASGSASGAGSGGGGGGGGDCRNGDAKAPRFNLVTFFEPIAGVVPATPGAAASAPAAAGAPAAGQTAPGEADAKAGAARAENAKKLLP